jgi:hypothetical protein
MSIGISVSARINASSSETWAALENIDSHVQWMKGSSQSTGACEQLTALLFSISIPTIARLGLGEPLLP